MDLELIFFYFTLVVNFPILLLFMVHSMFTLQKTSLVSHFRISGNFYKSILQNTVSSQTQRLAKSMFDVFNLQVFFSIFRWRV